jgi:tetratricopeptide (TPR) repeat protein
LYDQAVAATDPIIRLYDWEKFPEAFSLRAIALVYCGQVPRAIAAMRSNMRRFPKNIHVFIDFAAKCEEIRRYDLALQFYLRYALHCMSLQDIPKEVQTSFPYFLTEPQIEDLVKLHAVEDNGEVSISDLNIEQYFLSIERIADICLWFQDNEVFHNHQRLISNSQQEQEKSANMCALFNNFAVTIIDACFNYLDRLRNQTNRRGDHEALQAPMVIGFLYGIARMRKSTPDDISAGLRVINPLVTALSKNRALVIGEVDETNEGEEYVESLSLLKQQVRLVEELLEHGMLTRSVRLAVDLIKEYNYLITVFDAEEIAMHVSTILPSITRLATCLKKASSQGDSSLRSSCLAAATTAFAMAFKLDPNVDDLELTIRYADFLLHQQALVKANLADPNDSDDSSVDMNVDELQDELVFCPSEDLAYGMILALHRFETYYDQRVYSYTSNQSSLSTPAAASSSSSANAAGDKEDEDGSEADAEVEGQTGGDSSKDIIENAEMERVFGKLNDANAVPVKFSRTHLNYSILRKQKHAARFDVTTSMTTAVDAGNAEQDQDSTAQVKAVQSIYENKFSQEDLDRDIIGLTRWIAILRSNQMDAASTHLLPVCRILLPLVMCWLRNHDRYYCRLNQHLFRKKACTIESSIAPRSDTPTNLNAAAVPVDSESSTAKRAITFDPSIVPNLTLEVNKSRNKLSRDPRFEYLTLPHKVTVQSILYADAVLFECPEIISWITSENSCADYFSYIYSINLHTFISQLISMEVFCQNALILLDALKAIGHTSLSKQLSVVVKSYFEKLKAAEALPSSLNKRASGLTTSSLLLPPTSTTQPSSSSSSSSSSAALVKAPLKQMRALASTITVAATASVQDAEDDDDMDEEEYVSDRLASSTSKSKSLAARTIKKILSKGVPQHHPSSGVTAVPSNDLGDLFPEAHLSPLELNQFIQAAEVISDDTKQAALNLLRNSKQLASANLLVKSIISSAEHPLEHKYIEQTFSVNRFPIWFPENMGGFLLAGRERAQARKFAEALDKYLDAYELDPSQPLTCLYISSLLIFFAYFRLIKQRVEVLDKGLVFLERYKITRRLHADKIRDYLQENLVKIPAMVTEDDIIQEVYYNLGRAMSECEMQHLAVDNYQAALHVQDDYDYLHDSDMNAGGRVLPLTRQAAHNLVLILKKSQAFSQAYQIMRKYLSL